MEPEKNQAGETPNPEKNDDSPLSEGNGQEPERLYAGKYKTIEELEEGYKNTSGESSKMAEELNDYRKAVQDYEQIVRVVLNDEELRQGVEKRLSGQTSSDNSRKEVAKTPERDPQIVKVARQMENMIVDNFMSKHGLDQLDTDEQAKVKRDIGKYLEDVIDPQNVDLNKLPKQLENAYKLYKLDNAGDDRTEGTDYSSEIGKTKGAPSATPKDTTPSLTPQEKEAARKMGISEADYAKSKKAILDR